ncbi:hypothetical protein GGI07_000979 [Coemansia sp. Benny D115]|nr:hypothetical protein GGI07_000979 [Coemansia sp. Benny D115]
MHAPVSYTSSASAPQWPPHDEYAMPANMPCSAAPMSAPGSSDYSARKPHYYSLQHRSATSLPATNAHASFRRPSSIILDFHDSPPSAPLYPAKYYARPPPSHAIVDDACQAMPPVCSPGCTGNYSNSSSSTVSTPTSPGTPVHQQGGRYNTSHVHLHSYGYGSSIANQSTLHRNNTTKTVSNNDLAADCAIGVPASSRKYNRQLSPSRSANFALHQSHMQYVTLPPHLPSMPEVETESRASVAKSGGTGVVWEGMHMPPVPPLPLQHTGTRRSTASVVTIASATQTQTDAHEQTKGESTKPSATSDSLRSDSIESIHIANKIAADVSKIGEQYAYIPPRSKTLTITN